MGRDGGREGGEEQALSVGDKLRVKLRSEFLLDWLSAWTGIKSGQGRTGAKGVFYDRSDYEEMPLQNGQAIRAQHQGGSDSD